MQSPSIRLEDVYLSIPVITPGQQRLLRRPSFLTSSVGGGLSQSNGKVHVDAVKGVSLTVDEGDHLALLGHNGAGKTTILRMIAGIYPPTRGKVITTGSIGCVLDVNSAISPDMTGREAIKYYSLIYGHGDTDWRQIESDVADFTDLGDFLDLPIRTYSSGMQARLSAALATAWRQDILLIDEGIGAGDAAFQKKFESRLHSYMSNAGILVLASHSVDLLQRYCTRGALFSHGEMLFLGPVEDALRFYAEWQKAGA